MGIDMSSFNVVYESKVYRALSAELVFELRSTEHIGEYKPEKSEKLNVAVINEDNNIAIFHDDTEKFQFIARK